MVLWLTSNEIIISSETCVLGNCCSEQKPGHYQNLQRNQTLRAHPD